MRVKLLVFVLLGALVLPSAAGAIDGPRAVRHIKLAVKRNCLEEERRYHATCLGWRVWSCYKLSRRKVRCHSDQEYRHHGNWRICYFRTAAVENRSRTLVSLHFGRSRCYNESGGLLPRLLQHAGP